MRALLSPLTHEHPDAWRATVNRTLKSMMGADMVAFQLPCGVKDFLHSAEVDVALSSRYLPTLREHDPKFSYKAMERNVELQVCNRRTLWEDDLDEYYASAYYNELIAPARCFDMLCAAVRLEGEERPAALFFYHQDRRGPRFGERGLRLLRLLHPSFEAGARVFGLVHRYRKDLFRMLDAIDGCFFVYDMDGQLLHRSEGYHELGLGDREERPLSEAAGRLASRLAALCSARRSPSEGLAASRTSCSVWIGSRMLVLDGSLLEGTSVGQRLLVTVRDGGPSAKGPPSEREHSALEDVPAGDSAERFGLTPRQHEVALLLARRLTNREIAQRLGITGHTARRHTERVLLKLGIHSRHEVAARLFGPAESP